MASLRDIIRDVAKDETIYIRECIVKEIDTNSLTCTVVPADVEDKSDNYLYKIRYFKTTTPAVGSPVYVLMLNDTDGVVSVVTSSTGISMGTTSTDNYQIITGSSTVKAGAKDNNSAVYNLAPTQFLVDLLGNGKFDYRGDEFIVTNLIDLVLETDAGNLIALNDDYGIRMMVTEDKEHKISIGKATKYKKSKTEVVIGKAALPVLVSKDDKTKADTLYNTKIRDIILFPVDTKKPFTELDNLRSNLQQYFKFIDNAYFTDESKKESYYTKNFIYFLDQFIDILKGRYPAEKFDGAIAKAALKILPANRVYQDLISAISLLCDNHLYGKFYAMIDIKIIVDDYINYPFNGSDADKDYEFITDLIKRLENLKAVASKYNYDYSDDTKDAAIKNSKNFTYEELTLRNILIDLKNVVSDMNEALKIDIAAIKAFGITGVTYDVKSTANFTDNLKEIETAINTLLK